MKDYLVHGAQTIECVSVRIILDVTKIKGFRICVVDVKLAYLLSDKPMIRKIFITNSAPEFELSPEECLKLLKPIYGLADSEDEWHRTLDDHVQIDLKMTPITIDPSLYCQFEDNKLIRINGRYVDDLFRAGTDEWKTHSDTTHERFETTGNQQALFTFTGMHITESDNMCHIDQDFYMSKIEQIPSNAEFSKFASMRMKLAWLANTRPDIVLEISQIEQVTRAMYENDISTHCKRLNKAIKYVHDHNASIPIPKLNYDSLRITAYTDASFAYNIDLSSQLVRIVLLTDDNHNAMPVSYKSYKSRRVARSVLSGEVIAFENLFDNHLQSVSNWNSF